MNDLDSLFESVRGSAIADVIRDSKIILVTEFDAVHPLKTGEFWFEEESNTLYVGAGQMMGITTVFDALVHKTSFRVIEAPRIKFNNLIPTLSITHNTSYKYKIATRLYFSNHVNVAETIYHNTSDKITNKIKYSVHNNVDVTVTHRTGVI